MNLHDNIDSFKNLINLVSDYYKIDSAIDEVIIVLEKIIQSDVFNLK